jgi:hypothetical protein
VRGARQKIVAVCLLAFWLVATQHCGLEAAGVLSGHEAEAAGCCASSEGCENDGCATVEDGGYRLGNTAPILASPELVTCLWSVDWNLKVPPRELRTDVSFRTPFERPLDWLPTWQFVQRAALLPRAPSLV